MLTHGQHLKLIRRCVDSLSGSMDDASVEMIADADGRSFASARRGYREPDAGTDFDPDQPPDDSHQFFECRREVIGG